MVKLFEDASNGGRMTVGAFYRLSVTRIRPLRIRSLDLFTKISRIDTILAVGLGMG